MGVHVFHIDRPDLMMPIIARDARLIVWPGRGSQVANMNYVDMQPGEENVPHIHADSDDTIYILEGRGTIHDHSNGTSLQFEAGHVIHVPQGVEHQVVADRDSAIVSVGGPSPADLAMLRRAGALED